MKRKLIMAMGIAAGLIFCMIWIEFMAVIGIGLLKLLRLLAGTL